jgi:hypothetical protein
MEGPVTILKLKQLAAFINRMLIIYNFVDINRYRRVHAA